MYRGVRVAAVGLVVLAVFVCGCPGAMAPPGRHHALHGPQAVPPGQYEVTASTSGHLAHAMYPRRTGTAWAVGLRTGMSESATLDLQASSFLFTSAGGVDEPWETYLFSGHGGVAFHPSERLALEVGLGGGHSGAGAFLAPEFGMVVGSDEANTVQVVYGPSLFLSFPVTKRSVARSTVGKSGVQSGFAETTGLPDEAHAGAGFQQRLGLNITALDASDGPFGLEVRTGVGQMNALDMDISSGFWDFRFDFWAAAGLALTL